MFFKECVTISKTLLYLSIVILIGCSTPSIVATRSIQLGDFHNNQRNHAEAVEYYEAYLQASDKLGVYRNTETEADVHRKLAHSRSALGEYKVAEKHLQQAKELDSVINKNELALLEDIRLIGMLKAYQGDYRKALGFLSDVLNRSVDLISSNKSIDKESLLATYLSMARLRMVLGDFPEAKDLLSKAELLGKSISNYVEYSDEIHLARGIISREQGDLDVAETYINKSMELAKATSRLPSRQFEALAQIDLLKGNYEEALRNQLDAYKLATRVGVNDQIVNSLLRLGDIYKGIGDMRSAEESYRQALSLRPDVTFTSTSNSTSDVARLESNLDMYEFQGAKTGIGLAAMKLVEYKLGHEDSDGLESLLLMAESSFRVTGSDEGLSHTLLARARLSMQVGNHAVALMHIDSASKLSRQPDLQWKIFHQKGLIYTHLNDFDSAKSAYELSISIIERIRDHLNLEDLKSAFFSNKVEVYEDYIELLLDHYKRSRESGLLLEAFILNERARARSFLDMLGNKKVGYSSDDKSIIEEEQKLRVKIQQLNGQIFEAINRGHISALSRELEVAQEEYEQLLLDIKLNHTGYANLISIEPPDLVSLQDRLDDNSLIVEYWLGKNETTIWLISKLGIKAISVEVSESEISREIAAFRNAISLQMPEFIDNSLGMLYTHLIEPIESDIENYEHLIIVPNGVTHFLPFQALKNDEEKYLIERFTVSESPSASVWFYCRELSKSNSESRFLGMALGNASIGQFPSLPGTLKEVNQLAEIYEDFEIKSEQDFTEDFFKNSVSDYDYLHMATHGVLNKRQPGYSYLLMHPSGRNDGRLTVNEIFNIKLNARLVVLSACETGLGELSKGDDLVGLSRAFIYSGTSAVVVSLWKVDDATTSILMTRLHQYLESGKKASESLALAQRDMINGTVFDNRDLVDVSWQGQQLDQLNDTNSIGKNPYFWAPFILIGQ